MAVTIDRVALAKRLRIGQSASELEEVDDLLAYATEAVTNNAPGAPDVVHNEAVYRLAGYIYDRPFASADTRFSNVVRNSGAASALLPYRQHRLGLSGDVTETTEDESVLIQQSPYDATDTPTNIAAAYGTGRYRVELTSINAHSGYCTLLGKMHLPAIRGTS